MLRITTKIGSFLVPWDGALPILNSIDEGFHTDILLAYESGHYEEIPIASRDEPHWLDFWIALSVRCRTFREWIGKCYELREGFTSACFARSTDGLQVCTDQAFLEIGDPPPSHPPQWQAIADFHNIHVFFVRERNGIADITE